LSQWREKPVLTGGGSGKSMREKINTRKTTGSGKNSEIGTFFSTKKKEMVGKIMKKTTMRKGVAMGGKVSEAGGGQWSRHDSPGRPGKKESERGNITNNTYRTGDQYKGDAKRELRGRGNTRTR